jgi:hypothetical protein
LLTRGGDVYAASVAFEDPDAQGGLESLNLAAQRRLGDVAGRSGLSKVAKLSHGHGVLELAQGRPHDSFSLSLSPNRAIVPITKRASAEP